MNPDMKKTLLLILSALTCAVGVCNAETVTPVDSRIRYVGRVHKDMSDGSVSFDWSATTFKVKFSGKSLQMRCSDTHCDYFNVWIDRQSAAENDAVFKVESDTVITLFSGKKGIHEITVQKRTEGEQGCFTVREFSTDGNFLQVEPDKSRLIEFVGDSYTCGYGTEALAPTVHFRPEDENPSLTYADILGRYFDAETVHVSHSGLGVARNYNDNTTYATMTTLYEHTFDRFSDMSWTPSYTPDVVVIYLGTNDFSRGKQPSLSAWCKNYSLLLSRIRTFHGNVPILCVASKADPMLGLWVKLAVEKSGLKDVYAAEIDDAAHNNSTDLGADWHPNYSGHRKVAGIMASYISTITSWPLPFKICE